MSTPKSKKKENKLEVIRIAQDLAKYVMTITRNENIFNPIYEKLTMRLIQTAVDIPLLLIEANNTYVNKPSKAKKRLECQEEAKIEIRELICTMQMCQSVFKFRSNKTKHLVGLCLDTFKLINAWIKSDKERFKEFN